MKDNLVLINANKSVGRKVLTVPELIHGAVGTWQYVFCGKMKTLPVQVMDVKRTDVDYLPNSSDDNYGHIVMMDASGDMFEIAYQIIRA